MEPTVAAEPIDVLVLHTRPYDAREQFKKRVVTALSRFVERAPVAEFREREENSNWDLGADANISLIAVVLATALEQLGVRYKVWDLDSLLEHSGAQVAHDLRRGPRIIAVSSSHFTTESQFAEFIGFVRRHNTDATLIVGGQLLDVCPDLESTVPAVDYYVHGDGEIVFPSLVAAILERGGNPPVDFPGVRYRQDGRFDGSREWEPLDLDTLPLPRWDLVRQRDINDYAPQRSDLLPMVFVEESRGCLHHCAFCAYPRPSGYRPKSCDRVLEELHDCIRSGLTHFNFYSALFTCPPAHCREILDRIIDRNLDITFSCQARADDLYRNPDLVDRLQRAGCVHISMGIESGDPDLLKRMKKPLELDRVLEVVGRIHDAGISLAGNFFIGFPGETRESAARTYELIRRCNFWTLYLSSFVVEKNADVYRHRLDYGLEVSADGSSWRHDTMTSEQAEDETARLFVKLARDDVRTLLWVVQWRLPRLFPQLLMQGERPEAWEALRIMQQGVANEIEFDLDGGDSMLLEEKQQVLWERTLQPLAVLQEEPVTW